MITLIWGVVGFLIIFLTQIVFGDLFITAFAALLATLNVAVRSYQADQKRDLEIARKILKGILERVSE